MSCKDCEKIVEALKIFGRIARYLNDNPRPVDGRWLLSQFPNLKFLSSRPKDEPKPYSKEELCEMMKHPDEHCDCSPASPKQDATGTEAKNLDCDFCTMSRTGDCGSH